MKPTFAVTMGDPCGVGPEVVLKALKNHPELYNQCRLVVVGSREVLKKTAKIIKMDIEIPTVPEQDITSDLPEGLCCLDINPVDFAHTYGQITAEGGVHSYEYLAKAIDLSMQKKINGIVTAPINKKSLKAGKVPYLDHTEILGKLTRSERTMTLFVTGELRVFFYSRHIPFKDISAALNIDKLVDTLADCHTHLERIGIRNSKIALAALNPHGGEEGLFGTEEMEILTPAVKKAVGKGLNIEGPIPADSVFHLAVQGHYDGVLSLYHDQGHIAAKTYDFHRTVSLTMGLPFLRTSVDHGTAFDIAGKNIASETSMVEAIKAAVRYYW
jgi:4-hydroxythreonine-4-phosphate dehydrogenase